MKLKLIAALVVAALIYGCSSAPEPAKPGTGPKPGSKSEKKKQEEDAG